MKFFIDTGNIKEIRQAAELAILDGVTTNPSLIAKENKPFKEAILEICRIVNGPVSAEVTALEKDAMMRQGRDYASWHKNVVVKLPTTREGVQACKTLSGEGIKVNMTLCFSASQALIVAKAGAAYVSPFVGRLDEISASGLELVRQVVQIYKNYGFETQVLAASLRHPMHVVECALAGAHVGTMPWKVLDSLFQHPLTHKGLSQFMKDWESTRQSRHAQVRGKFRPENHGAASVGVRGRALAKPGGRLYQATSGDSSADVAQAWRNARPV